MKIIFFGTPSFAIPSLLKLNSREGIEIVEVITQPDKLAGRGNQKTEPEVKKAAEGLAIKVFQPNNQEELTEHLKGIKVDFFVVIAFGMILSEELLAIPKYGAINAHASLLPKYRGASPIHQSLLQGDEETGVTIIKMDKKMDHGPIIITKRQKIEEQDDRETLGAKLAILSAEILPHALEDLMNGTLFPIPQNDGSASYCKEVKKEDGKIDWNKSGSSIKNMMKAYKGWPTTYTEIGDKKLKILEADIEDFTENVQSPGKFYVEDKVLKIACKDKAIVPKKLQLEGKSEMDAKSFVNGYKNLFDT